ncbi:hypothetical protein T439DRAFT_355318 [Meredithblackwellia eburnea MCA 4105]
MKFLFCTLGVFSLGALAQQTFIPDPGFALIRLNRTVSACEEAWFKLEVPSDYHNQLEGKQVAVVHWHQKEDGVDNFKEKNILGDVIDVLYKPSEYEGSSHLYSWTPTADDVTDQARFVLGDLGKDVWAYSEPFAITTAPSSVSCDSSSSTNGTTATANRVARVDATKSPKDEDPPATLYKRWVVDPASQESHWDERDQVREAGWTGSREERSRRQVRRRLDSSSTFSSSSSSSSIDRRNWYDPIDKLVHKWADGTTAQVGVHNEGRRSRSRSRLRLVRRGFWSDVFNSWYGRKTYGLGGQTGAGDGEEPQHHRLPVSQTCK